jgi:hypothetical protein
MNFTDDVLLLGINKIEGWYGVYAAAMPFINSATNLLTVTYLKPKYGIELYPQFPTTSGEMLLKTGIDTLAITGIVANASHYGEKYSRVAGVLNGTLYTIFTFFVYNLLIKHILHSKSPLMNLIMGLLFIYLLEIMVHGITYCYIKRMEKTKK